MSVTVKVTIDSKLPSPKDAKEKAELALASEVLRTTRPFVPALTLALSNSAKVEDGKYVVYPKPYARYVWEGKRMVNANTGKGARWVDGYGWLHPKGSKLMATAEPLHYNSSLQPDENGGFVRVTKSKAPHAKAQDHWLEPSKEKNLKAWLKVVAKKLKEGESGAG